MYTHLVKLEKRIIEFLAIGLLAAAGVSTAIMYNMPKFAAAENAGMLHKVADRGVRVAVNAGVNTAIAGVDFNKSLKLAAINEATSAVFEAVGDFAATKGMADGSVGKVALHAGVGAGVAKLMGADPLIGALAAGTAEGLSSHIDNAGDKDSRVKTAGVIGAVTAFAAGGDVRTITSTATLTESARANNRELHPKEQQVLKYALANAKTDEERTRLKLAAHSMVHSSEGVPDADKHKSSLVASDAKGSLYAAEQAKLKATAQEIFGYSDAFKYSSLDSFDDSLSRHDKAFNRAIGGVDAVTGAGIFAKGGVLGKASGMVLATTGAAKLTGEYSSDIGERVLRSLEEPTGEYYVFRKADELAKDTAIALAAGKAIEKTVEVAAPAIKKIRARSGAVDESTTINGVWKEGQVTRGEIIEEKVGRNLHQNFPVVDRFEHGVVTSIKSLDLNAPTYQNPATLKRTLKKYVDKVAEFEGGKLVDFRIKPEQIKAKRLELVIPKTINSDQYEIIKQAKEYAKEKNIILKVIEVK